MAKKPMVSARPEILIINVVVKMPGGEIKTLSVDPNEMEGLFWTGRCSEILGDFYDKHHREVTADELKKSFGETKAKKIIRENHPHGDKARVTKKMIEELWKEPNDDGLDPVVIMKTKDCRPN